MNKEHNRYLMMFNNVQDVLDENIKLWSTVVVMANLKDEFDEIIKGIQKIYATNHDDGRVVTRQKDKLKETLCLKAAVLASALSALGEITDNEELKSFKTLTRSKLEYMREMDMVNSCNNILIVTRKQLEALKDYGISEAQVVEAEASHDQLRPLIGESRTVRNSVYANIKEADHLVDAGNNLLKQKMDKVINTFETTQPKFFDLYKRARVLVN